MRKQASQYMTSENLMSRYNTGVICNQENLNTEGQICWLSGDDRRSQISSKAHTSNNEVAHRNGVFSTGFISRLYISLENFAKLDLRKAHTLLCMRSQTYLFLKDGL